jgi:hypothetical protein
VKLSNQNKMEIEVIAEDKKIEPIKFESMYEAHIWEVYLKANGFKCETFVNGVTQNLPIDLQHPNTYKFKSE